MVLPLPVAWPGGLPCPWNRGTVDAVACRETARGKRRSQRSRPWIRLPSGLGSGAGLVGGALAAGVGHASTVRPDPSTLGAVGERGSHRESCSQLVSGSAGQGLDFLKPRRQHTLRWALEQGTRRVVGQHDGADVGEPLLEVVVLEVFVGGPHVYPQPVGSLVGRLGAGPVQQLGAQTL